MSNIEGGLFICYRHNFETDNVKKWDEHCFEEGHTEDVQQQCKNCGEWNHDPEYPRPERMVERMHANEQNIILLKCENCEGNTNEL